MCSAKDWIHSPPRAHPASRPKHRPPRRSKVRLHRLIVRRNEGHDMELKNLKLYLENRCILEENEKLRQKALRLRQENLALLSQFQKKFSSSQFSGSSNIN